MYETWSHLSRKWFICPVAGVVLGALAGTNPFYRPHLSLEFGIAAWFVDLAIVLILCLYPATVRARVLVAGLFMAVPCFLRELPLARLLLMCCAALPWAIAAAQSTAPPAADFGQRLSCAFTWVGTREVKRRARGFDGAALLRMVAASFVLGMAIAIVKGIPLAGLWWPVRWLAGGIMILAAAEMVTSGHDLLTQLAGLSAPALMRSPHRATSISEFWAQRWNPAASVGFHKLLFAPLARYGGGLALCAVFLASAVAHVMLAYMASGRAALSLVCGSFFLLQPPLIAVERRMRVRRWPAAAGRAWTLIALAVASPLVVEPALRLIEPSWAAAHDVWQPTIAVLGFVMLLNVFVLLGSLASILSSAAAEPSIPTLVDLTGGELATAMDNSATAEPSRSG